MTQPAADQVDEPEAADARVERVLYALLRPAARAALRANVPLKALTDWMQMALFHEARDRGMKLREVALSLQISPRKAALLSKRLKANFVDLDAQVALPRRIEYLLWAGPLSAARIGQTLPDTTPQAIADALRRLTDEGRVREVAGATPRFEVVRSEFRLVDAKGWLSKMDGLNALLGNVGRTVFSRFFGGERQQRGAFARNLALRIRRADRDKLEAFYRDVLWPFLAGLDEAAQASDDTEDVEVSVIWSTKSD